MSIIDQYSNYNLYLMSPVSKKRVLEKEHLLKIINALSEKLKKPYLRLMTVSGDGEAKAIVYEGDKNITKLIDISEIEHKIEDNDFNT